MELQIKLNPSTTIKIDAEDSKELIQQGAFWQSLPTECPTCKASIHFSYRAPGNFQYYGLKCNNPKQSHECNFGQLKSGGFFYKDDWKESWTEEK